MRIQFSDVYLGPAHQALSLDILTDALVPVTRSRSASART